MDTRRLISPFVVCLLWSASLTIELTVSQIDVQNVTTDGGLVDDASLWDLITSAAGTSLSPQADVRLNDSVSTSSRANDVSFNETLSSTNSWSVSNAATDVTCYACSNDVTPTDDVEQVDPCFASGAHLFELVKEVLRLNAISLEEPPFSREVRRSVTSAF